jgi:hypothetical protein
MTYEPFIRCRACISAQCCLGITSVNRIFFRNGSGAFGSIQNICPSSISVCENGEGSRRKNRDSGGQACLYCQDSGESNRMYSSPGEEHREEHQRYCHRCDKVFSDRKALMWDGRTNLFRKSFLNTGLIGCIPRNLPPPMKRLCHYTAVQSKRRK